MSRRSRGCLRCRQRRVKCDQGRPSCMRCITRNELCVGYREESDLIFQNETDKVLQRNEIPELTAQVSSSRSRSRSLSRLDTSSPSASPASVTSWQTDITLPEEEDPTVSKFMDNYVIYPCTETSNAGFLEHLPSLFKEVNVEGRFALRYAVQAAAYGDVSRQRQSSEDAKKALEYYGNALAALSTSLSEKSKVPDDYDLMTVVLLDIFETVFLPDDLNSGSHAQGMANILRLRGHEQFHDPRGWSLFRLAHHRLQKQQLAKGLSPMLESTEWLTSRAGDESFSHLEKDGLSINSLCHTARQTLSQIQDGTFSSQEIIPLVNKMIELDKEAMAWRTTPQWSFKTVDRELILGNEGLAALLPPTIELHRDIWMIYEWNYNRAARITLHDQLLACIEALSADESVSALLQTQHEASVAIVQSLANNVLATVPQSFGDIDSAGHLAIYHELFGSQAIGGYFLLWPIKIIKGEKSYSTPRQKAAAQAVFERIRDCTGMKTYLGSLSII